MTTSDIRLWKIVFQCERKQLTHVLAHDADDVQLRLKAYAWLGACGQRGDIKSIREITKP
jgi:hypothetical protein